MGHSLPCELVLWQCSFNPSGVSRHPKNATQYHWCLKTQQCCCPGQILPQSGSFKFARSSVWLLKGSRGCPQSKSCRKAPMYLMCSVSSCVNSWYQEFYRWMEKQKHKEIQLQPCSELVGEPESVWRWLTLVPCSNHCLFRILGAFKSLGSTFCSTSRSASFAHSR